MNLKCFVFCIFIALINFRGITLNAQNFGETTLEEYNYLTKGLKKTLSDGLDIKSGYKLKELYQQDSKGYTFAFSSFIKKDKHELVGISVIATSKDWGNVYYLCIPFQNENLNSEYLKFLKTWDAPILSEYSLALSSLFQTVLKSVLVSSAIETTDMPRLFHEDSLTK